MRFLNILAAAVVCAVLTATAAAQWKPAESTLVTRWTKDVSPDHAHPEYPRPQMVRDNWVNLNGLWQYAVRGRAEDRPDTFDDEILVPYPIQSALSGVKKAVTPDDRLWYRRVFAVPQSVGDSRLLLHFQAVDWEAEVWVNGKRVGGHRGGYDPFSFDITDVLVDGDQQELVLAVWDPSSQGPQPRGKQVLEPKGIWYTAVTGIWQTVWLETVPQTHIQSLKIVPDIDAGQLRLSVTTSAETTVRAEALDGGEVVAKAEGRGGETLQLDIPDAKLWSPDSPFLYLLRVGTGSEDEVAGYFGMRKIEVQKDKAGINRLFLNNEPLFQIGPLDQGWWPDGLYTAATDEALEYDVEITRKLGFNMARKHVKVEPARWYYHCDRLGLMVWQDMPSGGGAGEKIDDGERFPRSQFELELKRMIDAFGNHPCIVMWVPFNEGWGQHDTPTIVRAVQQYDPTRPVNEASGWSDEGSGDVKDVHRYPGPAMPALEENRVAVLGEFGGLGLPVPDHLWWDKRNWGYRNLTDLKELQVAYDGLIRRLRPMIAKGLAAAVYTQTSDVEGEVNGLMTYDRAVVKFDAPHMAALHAPLFLPPPIIITKTIVPTSRKEGQTWRYTTEKPADGWQKSDFDDSTWQQGQAGFGRESTPGAVVRTKWHTGDIWLRRTFQLAVVQTASVNLRVHHDEDAEVFLNGQLVAKLTGYESDYVDLELDQQAQRLLQTGENTLAVHCLQTSGGQYIDVGLVDVIEKREAAD